MFESWRTSTLLKTGPLAHPAFVRFWLGTMFSRIGDQFTTVALAWVVLDIAAPSDLGLVLASFGLPSIVSGLVAGRLLDHFQPRVLMTVDSLGRATGVAFIAVLYGIGTLEVGHIIAVALACGVLSPLTELGEVTLVPEFVDDEDLEQANALLSANWEVSALVGPLTAGVLIQWLGASPALLVDTATFLLMAAVAFSLPRMNRERNSLNAPGSTKFSIPKAFRESLSGFVLLWRMKLVGFLTLLGVAVLFLEGVREVLLPVLVLEDMGLDTAAYGALVSASGLGALLGFAVLIPLVRRLSPGIALSAVLILSGVLYVPLALIDALPAALIVIFLTGVASSPFYVVIRSAQQRLIPEHIRGRVIGAGGGLGVAGFPLGSTIGGLALSRVPAPWVIVLSAAALVALGVSVLAAPDLRVRERCGHDHSVAEM